MKKQSGYSVEMRTGGECSMSVFKSALAILLPASIVILGRVYCQNEALFYRQRGKYLPNRVIQTHQTNSEVECGILCSRDPSCASLNYKMTGDDQGLCELNNETLSDPQGELGKDISEFIYLGIAERNCKKFKRKFSPETKRCIRFGSCKEILEEDNSSTNGIYHLQKNYFSQPYAAYCHMNEISGCGRGWTLVMKINGSKNTFANNSFYWSDENTYESRNGLEGLTDKETKMASYSNTPFAKICLGMKVNGVTKWVQLDHEASSLYSVIADGKFQATTAGRDKWKALIAGSSLQTGCYREGFNVDEFFSNTVYVHARLGVIANNEITCESCDSWLGFGVSFASCGVVSKITCGNQAVCYGCDNGHKNTAAFGYILVQ